LANIRARNSTASGAVWTNDDKTGATSRQLTEQDEARIEVSFRISVLDPVGMENAPAAFLMSPIRRSPAQEKPQENLREIETLTDQLARYHQEMEEGQRELQELAGSADEVGKESAVSAAQNSQPKGDLAGFEDLKSYTSTINLLRMGFLRGKPFLEAGQSGRESAVWRPFGGEDCFAFRLQILEMKLRA
jgi:hypothetical protein